MTKNLKKALKVQKKKTVRNNLQILGNLGIPIGGQRTVEVPSRNGFVYVKLRDNQNEVIQAFNNKVAPSYGLPVIVERQGSRYIVIGVDTLRYQNNWSSYSPYLPRHGNTHSFNPEMGGGDDAVWVYSRQFIPALVFPSGSAGGPNVIVHPYTFKKSDGSWAYYGNTGTPNITQYKSPSGTQAVMVLVYLDTLSGNPYLIVGSGSYFSASITGTAQVLPYVPSLSDVSSIPLAAIRLVSGTSSISWDNIYDLRQYYYNITGASGGGSTPLNIQDEGVPLGTAGTMNFVGDGIDVSISGSVARVHVTGTSQVILQDEGIAQGAARILNFVGAPVDVSVTNQVARIFITGSAGGGISDASAGSGTFGRGDNTWLPVIPTDGWIKVTESWSRISDTSINVGSVNRQDRYRKSTKLRWKQGGGYKYGVSYNATFSAGSTIVDLIPTTDYIVSAGTGITDTWISYIENPEGFPTKFNWNEAVSGPTVGNGSLVSQWWPTGLGTLGYEITFVLGSTSAMGAFNFTPPVLPSTGGTRTPMGLLTCLNFGVLAYPGVVVNVAGSCVARVFNSTGTWAAQSALSSTIPFAWGTSDSIDITGDYKY